MNSVTCPISSQAQHGDLQIVACLIPTWELQLLKLKMEEACIKREQHEKPEQSDLMLICDTARLQLGVGKDPSSGL